MLMPTFISIPFEIKHEIVEWLIPFPASLWALALSCHAFFDLLSARTPATEQIWQRSYFSTFGHRPSQPIGRSWMSKIVHDVTLCRTTVVQIATFLVENYVVNFRVNYSENQLLRDVHNVFPTCTHTQLMQSLALATPALCDELRSQGDSWKLDALAYFQTKGTGSPMWYRTLQYRGSLPIHFSENAVPANVYILYTSSVLFDCSMKIGLEQKRAHNYFLDTLPNLMTILSNLVHTTHRSTNRFLGTELPLVVRHYLLPHIQNIQQESWNMALSSIPHYEHCPTSITGGGDTFAQAMVDAGSQNVLVLNMHAAGDWGYVVDWVDRLRPLSEGSSLGYALRSDDDTVQRRNMDIFGRHHLDYILSIRLGALRQYHRWCLINDKRSTYKPSLVCLLNDVGLDQNDATRLYEMIVRTESRRGRGNGDYRSGRIAGEAIPVD